LIGLGDRSGREGGREIDAYCGRRYDKKQQALVARALSAGQFNCRHFGNDLETISAHWPMVMGHIHHFLPRTV
jgi:hypothetical protein